METYAQLDLVAQIAAALLGFIAIFLALYRKDGKFAQSDRHFIQALVMSASIAVVLSIMPRALGMIVGIDDAWSYASFAALAIGAPAIGMQAWQQVRMTREEADQIHAIWHLGAWALCVASTILFVIAILGETATSAYYVAGVTMLVPLSLWVFTGVVFRRFF